MIRGRGTSTVERIAIVIALFLGAMRVRDRFRAGILALRRVLRSSAHLKNRRMRLLRL